ncbi:hypothetical protein BWI15_00345 [Kribbella sp. ALI-6-A]|uniref:hypothetical protein n=1 Tax=Kribbella sp. ALI-6-A TaxID=1933817 RepID=UPI00097BF36A|nr:hypothetical protein [Kribbella sp. ALI-6-A]ONI79061.1 hypothetical protein BWI15_00345 [Kribbella sp. ALI-6-A]
MLGRFTVRPATGDDGPFAVWDNAVNGWRATGLDEVAAEEMKADLDLQYDAHGPRPAGDVRRAEPARPVQYADWHPGELDAWIRDGGQWLGRVRDRDGRVSWIPASDLRPAGQDSP